MPIRGNRDSPVRWGFVTKTKIAIIGGGITGLCAAFTLQKRGIPYRLVEAGPFLGGVIRTETRDGFLLEGGPDSILAQKPEGLALCRELGLGTGWCRRTRTTARSTSCAAAGCTRCPRA